MVSWLDKRLAEQKTSQRKSILITGVLITLLLIVGVFVYWIFNSISHFEKDKQALGVASPPKINILVLGINKRRDDVGRSNVTCVVTIETDTKKVSMLWVPRDSRVKIQGNEWNKIGHAYAYKGPELSKKTVEDLLGIQINYYLAVDMSGFSKVIDAIGGVDINVEKRLYYYDPYDEGEAANNNGLIDLKPGMQHMDGNTALQYVRFRNDEMGDIGRIERQQKFSMALLTKLASPAVITKIPAIISEVRDAIKTDLPAGEMLSLANIINDAYKRGLKTNMEIGRAHV